MVVDVLSNLREGLNFAVLGNHDQWDGKHTAERLVNKLERIGVSVLRNRSEAVRRGKETIYIGGTDDYWFSYDLDKTLRTVPESAFKIILSHNPDVRADMNQETRVDLALCGHTHGGQLAIPFLSHHFVPIKNPARYLSGIVKEPYGYTYVNRGIGTLVFPFRLAAPPEITCFTLRKA
jgi:predicted MPP superfamily phosphohydrolase